MKAQGINLHGLDETDKGRWVRYTPAFGGPRECGRIKLWNEKWIFVVYKCDQDLDRYEEYTAVATDPKDLDFIQEP